MNVSVCECVNECVKCGSVGVCKCVSVRVYERGESCEVRSDGP